ncbi:alpha/beta hydrolase [uncultured Roseobacter sp.]|uniref:alpha/beta hydrolase n=1 Tax=uncultured Roseobacter sp. TaxID=114847 RepID=UPI00260FF16A|nr:alpha/beta hydrolase [uncultured Roseobacter sp.]
MSHDSYIYKETLGQGDAPLVFTFHGTGGNEAQFHDLATHLLPGAHVISPRGDVSEQGAARFFRRTGEGVYDMADLAARTDAMAHFISAHVARLAPSRVIGLGYSNGANILASVMLAQPDLVQEVVLLHPLIPWQPTPQPELRKTRVLISAGERDPICPPEQTQALQRYLSAQGSDVQIHWHAGGHEIAQSELGAVQDFLSTAPGKD